MRRALFSALLAVALAAVTAASSRQDTPPLRLAIAGLVHGHVEAFVRAALKRSDVQVVGIFDPDAALLRSYGEKFALPDAARFTALDAMIARVHPDAIASFTNTHDHPLVVEAAAARHVTVMMEKPLAVSNADAQRIRRAADAGGIAVMVNYETTWYPTHAAIWQLMKEQKTAGAIRKMVA